MRVDTGKHLKLDTAAEQNVWETSQSGSIVAAASEVDSVRFIMHPDAGDDLM